MQKSIYDIQPQEGSVDETLEELRLKLAKIVGVTLQGNRLTVRWHDPKDRGKLKSVHMVILEVDDGEPENE